MINFEKLQKSEYLKFYKSLYCAKNHNKHGCFVSIETPEFYSGTENFLYGEGIAGFAIRDGDLIAAHKNPTLSKELSDTRVINDIMLTAYKNGAEKLDCYGDVLSEKYMQYGYLPVAKMKFSLDYNPTWPVEKFGYPDVIVMLSVIKDINDLMDLHKSDSLVKFSDIKCNLKEFDDYVKMMQYRDSCLIMFKGKQSTYEEIKGCLYNKKQIESD